MDRWEKASDVCLLIYKHRRLCGGLLLWLVAMFALAIAAEGINKNEWIGLGAIPITLLTIGFILPRNSF